MEVFKAPKITNSHSFNHIKNDEVTGISSTIPVNSDTTNKRQAKVGQNETQFQKSAYPAQQPDDEELRTTWKHGPPKINSNKLPSAFSNPITLKGRQQRVQPLLGGNKNINVKVSQEIQISKLENYEAIQEYKQVNLMLSPLKKRENSMNKPSQPANQQAQSKNPLAPLKHFIKNQQKINEELGMNLNEIHSKQELLQHGGLLQGSIKMEEMITTDVIRSYADQSPVKKMLHAPTLKIYIVKEEPLQSKEIRKNIKEWIQIWQNKIGNSQLHVKVISTFWNTPEGYVSIVMEHLNGGSLQVQYFRQLKNLFESVGYLPERAIKQIAQPILQGLQKIHSIGAYCHGALAPSQVLFTRDGQVKLSLGISYRIQQPNKDSGFNSYLLGKNKDLQSLYEPSALETPSLWNKGSSERIQFPGQTEGFNLEKANDIWKLGLLFLNCAIGTLEFHPKAQTLHEGFRLVLEEVHKYQDQLKDTCCLLHSEQIFIQVVETAKQIQTQPDKTIDISLLDLINDKFSQEFVQFLCAMLKIDPRKRTPIDQLTLQTFLSNKHEPKGPKVTLKDLLQLSTAWNSQLPEEYQGQSENKLDRIADALTIVLANCEKHQINRQILQEDSSTMRELAYEMGLNVKTIGSRFAPIFDLVSPQPSKKQ